MDVNLVFDDSDYTNRINTFHFHCCKKIQGINKQTKLAMSESLSELIRLTTEIDKRKLSFLHIWQNKFS